MLLVFLFPNPFRVDVVWEGSGVERVWFPMMEYKSAGVKMIPNVLLLCDAGFPVILPPKSLHVKM